MVTRQRKRVLEVLDDFAGDLTVEAGSLNPLPGIGGVASPTLAPPLPHVPQANSS
jgi:hypothetical protein